MPTDKGPAESTKAVMVEVMSFSICGQGPCCETTTRVDGHRFSVRSAWERVEAASEAAALPGAHSSPGTGSPEHPHGASTRKWVNGVNSALRKPENPLSYGRLWILGQ